MNAVMKTDKWYQKLIVVFYKIIMPIFIIFLFFVAPQIGLLQKRGIDDKDLTFKIIICLVFCLFYFNSPYISKSFWYFQVDCKRTNVVVYPNSKALSILMIFTRFIVVFGATQFVFEFYWPLFGNYNFVASGINSLLLTIPVIAQYFALKN